MAAAPSEEDLKVYALSQKYTEEATKRLRPELDDQFVNLKDAGEPRVRALSDDLWADHAALNARELVKDGSRYKFVILGGGLGGQLLAVRLIEAGLVKGAGDLLIIDIAGGFGGTWYWNRYPGLHCDVESYTYMPLLEETGYVPKFKYAPGYEILEHAERIATQWNLNDKALFRSKITAATWGEEKSLWSLDVIESRGPGEEERKLKIQADYFISANGILAVPQAPRVDGLASFAGQMFHTARWDYSITGGSQENPQLTGLEGKRVGILGTGATAIQSVPHLAKFAKELYVFQRTPSAVYERGQRPTDLEKWESKIAYKKGWQKERMENFALYCCGAPTDQPNMVDDEWTKLPGLRGQTGTPLFDLIQPTPEGIGAHIARLLKWNIPCGEKAHARVDAIVKDPETAAKLKAWYPVWCKRPTYNDEYLPTFNLPNVHLIDTDGKGVDSATERGLVVAGKEYPLDVLVLGTGFRSPLEGNGCPSVKMGVKIHGRGGRSFEEKWNTQGATTLYGTATSGFPNLFFMSPIQNGTAANWLHSCSVWTDNIVATIAKAESRVGDGSRPVVEVTVAGEEGWAGVMMQHAAAFAALSGCTPGYGNASGAFGGMPKDQAEMLKAARMAIWSFGIVSFTKLLEDYRAEGSLQGVEVTPVAA
ncbi:pyridine nucleotide-disulfide oxidoreductase-like protein [Cercophora newfieldiana]|uniref:Pyridine nucleotide-disulfide oxidoreductase-like protein n=1 Tax=Cercophora newfieldiana TaxID=92897 RepID=A0AA39YIW7_9PEZI|nr:pyridine nucleotide-disulfide oxidoreductase-like protein [Cercophora newfieldiana]